MENGELRSALCAHIEIISEGNTIILNYQFSILNSPLAALNNNLRCIMEGKSASVNRSAFGYSSLVCSGAGLILGAAGLRKLLGGR